MSVDSSDSAGARVTVTIVNYFTARHVSTCLDGLLAEPVTSIRILDNSVDDVEWQRISSLSMRDTRIDVVRGAANVGFGAGHNRLIEEIDGADDDLVWILNPDTAIVRGCVKSLLDSYERVTRPAVLSPLILRGGSDRPTVWFAGGTLDRTSGVVAHEGYGSPVGTEYTGVTPTQFMCGAAMFMDLETWRRSGGFREDLFLYWEDVEFSARCSDGGIGLAVDLDARIWHDEGGSQQQTTVHSAVYYRYMNRNRVRILAQWISLRDIVFGSAMRRTLGLVSEPVRFGGPRAWREFRSGVRGLLEGLLTVTLERNRSAGSVGTRLVVHAPTPDGGHPEYVFKQLSGLLAASTDFDVVWPRRPDLDPAFVHERFVQPVAIAMQKPREELSTLRWFVERVHLGKRHDLAFCTWLIRQRRADVVLVEEIQRFTLLVVVAACSSIGARTVVHLHNVRRHDFTGSITDRVDEYLTGLALRRADCVIVHSDANRSSVAKTFGPDIDVRVVPHGITPAVTAPFTPPHFPNFLFFGEIRPNKGAADLVMAFRELGDEFRLTIAGRVDPGIRKALARSVEGEPRITWEDGFVPSDRVRELFTGATAVVLPYTEFDAQSGVLHLAIEHGVPVVVTNVGALGETVTAFDIGSVVPAGDVTALREAMIDIADHERNKRLRDNVIDAQTGLDWATVGRALADVLSPSAAQADHNRRG